MSGGPGWTDPYSDDEAGTERERRRAEREARRRERLGQRVREGMEEEQPPPSPPAAPAQPTQPVAPPEPAARQPTQEHAAHPPTAQQASAPPAPDQPPGHQAASPPPPRRPPSSVVARRRLFALIGVLALAFSAFVVVVAAKNLGGDDEPARPPPEPRKTVELVIPEGYSRDQMASVAKEAGLVGDYEKETESFKGFDPGKYGAKNPANLEGFLFPATYELFKNATAKDLVAKQLEAFEQNVESVDFSLAESKNLTKYDVLIIASMIEREVQVPEERGNVASVIYNRLEAGMPLGIDATIRFEDENYDEQLLESRLNEDTPYNTRTNTGLPPGPIGSPGLDSIEAAANPANTDFRFFVVKPGTCGEHVFTETEEEFFAAEREYQAALQAEGGSPTEC